MEYPQFKYHQLRQVYLFSNQKDAAAKKLQKNANIFNLMRIYDEYKYDALKADKTINVYEAEEIINV